MQTSPKQRRPLRIEVLERRLFLSTQGVLAVDGILLKSLDTPDQVLRIDTPHEDYLDETNRVDEYEIELSSPGRLRVRSDSPQNSSLDSFLSLVNDSTGLPLAQSDDVSLGDSGTLIDQHLGPGTYHLQVSASSHADADSHVGAYTLTTSWEPAAPPFTSIDLPEQPQAVATADFNGDTILDMAVADRVSGTVSILLGSGDGTFRQQLHGPPLAAGEAPGSIVAADFDGDGDIDLAVANRTSGTVSLFVNEDNANFRTPDQISVGKGPRNLATGDLDGDGLPDLVVPNQDDDTVIVLFTRSGPLLSDFRDTQADSFFPKRKKFKTDDSPRSAAIADLDGNGQADLAVANRVDDNIVVFRGEVRQGALSFVEHRDRLSLPEGTCPFQMVARDFDGDEKADLATVNDKAGSVSIFSKISLDKSGDTTYSYREYDVGDDAEVIVCGHFNSDENIDLATGNQDSRDVSILLGRPDGTFEEHISVPVAHTIDDMASGDFNKDGRLDLVLASREGAVDIRLGRGDGTFPAGDGSYVGDNPNAIVAGDFNGDGLIDTATANANSNDVSIVLGRGDGSLQSEMRFEVGEVPHAIVAGDFNRDGRLDLATANERSDDVSILLGLGDGHFRLLENVPVGSSPCSIVAEDFDADGNLDLATANRKADHFDVRGTVSVLYGQGDGFFSEEVRLQVGQLPELLVSADFNNDELPDLGVVNRLSHDVTMLVNEGNRGSFTTETAMEFPPDIAFDPSMVPGWKDTSVAGTDREARWFFPFAVAMGDYNEDGYADLAVANDIAHEISIFLGIGDGSYRPEIRFPVVEDPEWIVVEDVNDDHHLDLIVAHGDSDAISILLGLGNGAFQREQELGVGETPECLVTGHFNNDTVVDVVVQNDDQIWFIAGQIKDEEFSLQENTIEITDVGAGAQELVSGYFNDDGFLDLAVANSYDKSVSILLGNGDGTFGRYDIPLGTDARSLATEDIDGDGNLDLVLAGLSDSSVWVLWGTGSGQFEKDRIYWDDTPSTLPGDLGIASVVVADFNGDGRRDIAKGNSLENTVSVLFATSNRTFDAKTYEVGSSPGPLATDLVDGDDHPDLITGNRGSHDVSILLWSDDATTTGTFIAQEPIAGGQHPSPMMTADFNGDGRVDKVVADESANTVSVFINLGQDEFVESHRVAAEIQSTPILADLNGDTLLDSIQLSLQGDILIRFADRGGFAPAQVANPGRPARDVALVSTHAGTFLAAVDQKVDLEGGTIKLYAFDASGRFVPNSTVPVGLFPTKLDAADLNGDGQDDLVLVDGGEQQVSILLADNEGGFISSRSSIPVGNVPGRPMLVDVGSPNGGPDGWIDVVVPNELSGDISILYNDGTGQFTSEPLRLRASQGLYGVQPGSDNATYVVYSHARATGLAEGDFNHDGSLDLVVTNRGLNTFSILLGKQNGGFADPVEYPSGSDPANVRSGDFNDDGYLDLAVLSHVSETVTILLGKADGTFEEGYTAGAGNSSRGLTVEDVTNDGVLDLLVGNAWGDLLILRGNGDGTFEPYSRAGDHVAMAVADFNGDGHEDSVIVDESSDTLTVWLSDGKDFEEKPRFTLDRDGGLTAPRDVDSVDIDGDGIPDILVANSGRNDLMVLLGRGDGTFEPPQSFSVGMRPVAFATQDFNDDGRLDIVVANELSNDVSVWLGSGSADSLLEPGPRPQLQASLPDGRIVYGEGPVSVEVTDYDEDGWIDLIVSAAASGQTFLFPGRRGSFAEPVLFQEEPILFDAAGQILFGQYNKATPESELVIVDAAAGSLRMYDAFSPTAAVNYALPMLGSLPLLTNDYDLDGYDDFMASSEDGRSIDFMPGWIGDFDQPYTLYMDDAYLVAWEVTSVSLEATTIAAVRQTEGKAPELTHIVLSPGGALPRYFSPFPKEKGPGGSGSSVGGRTTVRREGPEKPSKPFSEASKSYLDPKLDTLGSGGHDIDPKPPGPPDPDPEPPEPEPEPDPDPEPPEPDPDPEPPEPDPEADSMEPHGPTDNGRKSEGKDEEEREENREESADEKAIGTEELDQGLTDSKHHQDLQSTSGRSTPDHMASANLVDAVFDSYATQHDSTSVFVASEWGRLLDDPIRPIPWIDRRTDCQGDIWPNTEVVAHLQRDEPTDRYDALVVQDTSEEELPIWTAIGLTATIAAAAGTRLSRRFQREQDQLTGK